MEKVKNFEKELKLLISKFKEQYSYKNASIYAKQLVLLDGNFKNK
jgi:hypothetical protein